MPPDPASRALTRYVAHVVNANAAILNNLMFTHLDYAAIGLSELSPMERIDVAVIGAGVTGLASARAIAFAERGRSICVLERHPRPGHGHEHAQQRRHPRRHLLSRRLAQGAAVRRGRAICCTSSARATACRTCARGKLIVAHDEHEIAQLEALQRRGAANGVAGLEIVDRAFIAAREPAVNTRLRAAGRPTAASSTPRSS